MNTNLLTLVKQIVAEHGEDILSEPRRVFEILTETAKEIPKPQKSAFVKCLKRKSAQALKSTAKPERDACKQQLAQKLHDEEGIDPELCTEAYELLAAVLFGEEKEVIYCKNCGRELQEGWIKCPYCSTPINTSQTITSAISSGSGGRGYGVEQIRPETVRISTPQNTGYTFNQNTEQKKFPWIWVIIGIIVFISSIMGTC